MRYAIDAGLDYSALVSAIEDLRRVGASVWFEASDVFKRHTGIVLFLNNNLKVTWMESLFYYPEDMGGSVIPYDHDNRITDRFMTKQELNEKGYGVPEKYNLDNKPVFERDFESGYYKIIGDSIYINSDKGYEKLFPEYVLYNH